MINLRTAAKISLERLKDIIKNLVDDYDLIDMGDMIYELRTHGVIFNVQFDEEPATAGFNPDDFTNSNGVLIGYKTLDNELSFLGFISNGEYAPVFSIIYYDGVSLKGYTPRFGNIINPESDAELNDYSNDDEKYIRMYGVESVEDITLDYLDWELIRSDIIHNIKVSNHG